MKIAIYRTYMGGGVSLTMAKVRERFWIPKLRSLTKKIRSAYHRCKVFNATAFKSPPPGKLPLERITATTKPFDVVGVDYAGPFVTRKGKKVYLLLFSCSVSRALHLELLKNQTMDGFLTAIKTLIAGRGMPKIIYSDNAKTFKAAAKWLKRIIHSGELMHFCSRKNIQP